jgi:hypothetical protein
MVISTSDQRAGCVSHTLPQDWGYFHENTREAISYYYFILFYLCPYNYQAGWICAKSVFYSDLPYSSLALTSVRTGRMQTLFFQIQVIFRQSFLGHCTYYCTVTHMYSHTHTNTHTHTHTYTHTLFDKNKLQWLRKKITLNISNVFKVNFELLTHQLFHV